jgi:hypothetical protein
LKSSSSDRFGLKRLVIERSYHPENIPVHSFESAYANSVASRVRRGRSSWSCLWYISEESSHGRIRVPSTFISRPIRTVRHPRLALSRIGCAILVHRRIRIPLRERSPILRDS